MSKRPYSVAARVALTLLLTACRYTPTPSAPEQPPTPPPNPAPTMFPVTEVSGVIPNWTGGAATLTLAGGLESDFEGGAETVALAPPAYAATLSAQGSFTVPLATPRASERDVLACDGAEVELAVLAVAVVSTGPEPARPEQVRGVFTLRPPADSSRRAVWLYSDGARRLDATCSPPDASPVATKLDLVPGWNQAVLTGGETPRLESRAVPAAFVFAE